MFTKTLHPVDLRESISEIQKRCAFIKRFSGQEIVFVHVMNPGVGDADKAGKKLGRLSSHAQKTGLKARSILVSGSTALEITAAAAGEKAGLIYMPASRKNFLVSSLMGSVTDDVIRLSTVPVFVHKQRPVLTGNGHVQKMIFATDFGSTARKAEEYLSWLGEWVPELILLHVGERAADPYTEQLRREKVESELENLKEQFKDGFEEIKHFARIGSPAKHIMDVSEETGADLVLLGRINEPFPSSILGSTCSRVASGVRCSVLIIP